MSDPLPPRIRVALPGGQDVPGRLIRWRQDKTGAWWAAVEVYVHAAAVQQVAGEDYDQVPREPAEIEPRYVMVAFQDPDGKRKAEMHVADCRAIPHGSSTHRVTPMPDADAAKGMLAFDDTTPCTVCTPEP